MKKTTQEKKAPTDPVEIGMVFGVFDGLHQGHEHFLSKASAQCKKLIVVVTLDEVVFLLKKHTPKYPYEKRCEQIRSFNPSYEIVPSDPSIGKWEIFRRHHVDKVFLGYDQTTIARELTRIQKPFEIIESAYEPEIFHSSILHKK